MGTLGPAVEAERGREDEPVGLGPLKKLNGPAPVGNTAVKAAGGSVKSAGMSDKFLLNVVKDPVAVARTVLRERSIKAAWRDKRTHSIV